MLTSIILRHQALHIYIYIYVCISKVVYWKVITLQIEYIKRCLLKVITFHIGYIIKVSIERKCEYWPKMCPFNENVSINRKGILWMKMCLLEGHNSLGINSSSYSFGNFFSYIFLRNTKYLWALSILFFSIIGFCSNIYVLCETVNKYWNLRGKIKSHNMVLTHWN